MLVFPVPNWQQQQLVLMKIEIKGEHVSGSRRGRARRCVHVCDETPPKCEVIKIYGDQQSRGVRKARICEGSPAHMLYFCNLKPFRMKSGTHTHTHTRVCGERIRRGGEIENSCNQKQIFRFIAPAFFQLYNPSHKEGEQRRQ
jgi:hypothetical protein